MRTKRSGRLAKRVTSISFVAIAAVMGVAGATLAQSNGPDVSAPAGTPVTPEMEKEAAKSSALIGGTVYDPTILTKRIPAAGFTNMSPVVQDQSGISCRKGSGASALDDVFYAPVSLPEGARIRRYRFYGENLNNTGALVILVRGAVSIPLLIAAPSRIGDVTIGSFNTGGSVGVKAISSADNLEEVAGNIGSTSIFTVGPTAHRFHTMEVYLRGNVLCGVEIDYEVLAPANPGTVFVPITPARAYDSRQAGYTVNGPLAPNGSRIINVSDAHTAAGAVLTAGVVPIGATAVTYNLTVANPTGPNFMAITPGNSTSFVASAINFNGTADIANGGTAAIAADRTIKVWNGDQSGSTQFVIDITGYYIPATFPGTAA